MRTCLDCDTSLEGAHHSRQRCEPHAKLARTRASARWRERHPEQAKAIVTASNHRRRPPKVKPSSCAQCGAPITQVTRPTGGGKPRLYCSAVCSQRAHKGHQERDCLACGKPGVGRRYCSASCRKQSARIRRSGAPRRAITQREWRQLAAQPCLACGTTERLTLEHLVPLDRGGWHSVGNLAALCLACNSSKASLTWTEWRASTTRPQLPGHLRLGRGGRGEAPAPSHQLAATRAPAITEKRAA